MSTEDVPCVFRRFCDATSPAKGRCPSRHTGAEGFASGLDAFFDRAQSSNLTPPPPAGGPPPLDRGGLGVWTNTEICFLSFGG